MSAHMHPIESFKPEVGSSIYFNYGNRVYRMLKHSELLAPWKQASDSRAFQFNWSIYWGLALKKKRGKEKYERISISKKAYRIRKYLTLANK